MKKILRKGMLSLAAVLLLCTMSGCASADEELTKRDSVSADEELTKQDSVSADEALSGQAGAPAGDTSTGQTSASADHLLSVWSDYLRVQEEMYASSLWALDYTEQFLDSKDWKDLVKARTACIASARFLSELSMTEEDLSDEEYTALAEAGADSSFQSMEIEALPEKVGDEHDFVRNHLLERLESGVFLTGETEVLRETLAFHREYIEKLCESECLTVNYLLLTLGDQEGARGFWGKMPEEYPILSAGHPDWDGSETNLEKRMEQCLDQIEESTLSQADSQAALSAEAYNIKKIVESNDFKKLREEAFAVKNAPELLPMPEWYDPENAGYLSFLHEKDGSLAYPESGDRLEEGADGVYLQIEGLSAEAIERYVSGVNGQNVAKAVRKDKEADVWDIVMTGYAVRISLEGSTATVIFDGEDVTFVPEWYIGMQPAK